MVSACWVSGGAAARAESARAVESARAIESTADAESARATESAEKAAAAMESAAGWAFLTFRAFRALRGALGFGRLSPVRASVRSGRKVGEAADGDGEAAEAMEAREK